ncbi:MAG: glutamate synthase subunit beta [Candidatus Saganbacteria bacterium]|nr:glutamate synthase subunit beta [Candidatus Saganbacteria bacterium]
MGKPRGFLEVKRKETEYRPVCERVQDYAEVVRPRPDDVSRAQASRCMDCGTPFCHWGCPLGNYIPEWNDLMFNGQWGRAFALLNATNELPEVTGRICPAPCEFACVLGINDDAVTIRDNELAIVEQAFENGLVRPQPPAVRTGKRVAVVGSGPAGLACAARLNRFGHAVTVFERDDKVGGLMRYGIPDFKLEKRVLDRRLALWQKEGIEFKTGVTAGAKELKGFDAAVLAGGSRVPRDLKIPGRELAGVHFALDYLVRANRGEREEARGKKVAVIGGGDTGADCVGTANRQGAASVVQIELLPRPPQARPPDQPWPSYPMILKTSTSHGEGCERLWSVSTKEVKSQKSKVKSLACVKVDNKLKEIPGTEFEIEADLVVLALGFLRPEPVSGLALELDQRGNVKTGGNYQTSLPGIFAAGDMRRGQSLVVWAVHEGREAAGAVERYLKEEQ